MQVETLLFNKLLTFSHLLLEMLPFGPHTSSNTTAPLVNCTVNNALFHTVPNVRQMLLQFSDVVNSRLVDALLDAAYKEYLTSSDTGTINKENCVLFVQ